ncbi:MAG: hypothetical protein ACRELD_04200 [Longimicrobiales bacterium]
MSSRLLGTVPLLAVLALAAPAAAAQEPPDTAELPRRPFVEGGVYDKPYLTRLLGRTAIGGYAEAHARWQRVDGVREEAGFQLKRWNIFTATQVNDYIRIGAELEFEDLGEEVLIEFAAIDFTIHPSFTLRAGAILSPLGRFNLAHDSPRNEFTDRPLVSTEIIGVALTEPGLGALGQLTLGDQGRVTYELYAVNGFNDGLIYESADGTRIPAGKRNAHDNNASPAAVGRLAWSPRLGYELGVSGHRGAYNVFHADGEQVDDRRDLTILALDLEGTLAGVDISGEAVSATLDIPPGLTSIYASRQRGLYVQAIRRFGHGWIRTITGSYFEAGTRLDLVDHDANIAGDAMQRLTLGLNFRPSEDAVLKLNYLRGRARDRFNNLSDDAGLLFSIATYF